MWTEATLVMLMLISSWLIHERLRRITALSVTSMYVGKSRLPRVKRLARKISDGIADAATCHPGAVEVKLHCAVACRIWRGILPLEELLSLKM
jgi:hypothetical protein